MNRQNQWLFEAPPTSAMTNSINPDVSQEYYNPKWELPGSFGENEWRSIGEFEEESPVTPSSRRVRFFTCSNSEKAKIENFLSMSIPVEALRSAVDSAAGKAVSSALKAARALETVPRSSKTKRLFCRAFGVMPEFVPPWRPAKARWKDLGGLVAIRLRDAAKIVDGGWIKYFCWGSPAHCPECSASPPTYFACSSFKGKYIICLGQGFWRAWQNRDNATMASTLIHESLHIYFGRTVSDTRFSGNANCYERFVVQFNGLFLHPATASNCPAKNCARVT
jgi:hypothetical protein